MSASRQTGTSGKPGPSPMPPAERKAHMEITLRPWCLGIGCLFLLCCVGILLWNQPGSGAASTVLAGVASSLITYGTGGRDK